MQGECRQREQLLICMHTSWYYPCQSVTKENNKKVSQKIGAATYVEEQIDVKC